MRLFKTILLLGLLATGSVPAADLEVQVRNHVSGTVNNRRVALKLQQPGSVVAGPWLVAGDYVVQYTTNTGVTVFSNVLAGDYSVTIYGSPERSFVFTVPDTNGYVNVAELTGTNSTPNYYTAAQVDALLSATGNGVSIAAGDNVTTETNGALVTISANVPANAITNLQTTPVTLASNLALSGNILTLGTNDSVSTSTLRLWDASAEAFKDVTFNDSVLALSGVTIQAGQLQLSSTPSFDTTGNAATATTADKVPYGDASSSTVQRLMTQIEDADGLAYRGPSYNGANNTIAANISGTAPAASLTGIVPAANGGAGTVNGLLKANGSGTVSAATAGTDYLAPNGSGASLTALNASQLTSGTIPDARFPATLPAASGANLTALNGTQITSGTIPKAALANVLGIIATNATLPVFNVKGFGALGDGSTEDTQAILDAVTAAKLLNGGVIFFPASENPYAVKLSNNAGAINITNAHNITFLGEGDKSRIKLIDAVNGNVTVLKVWVTTNFAIRDICIDGGSDVRAFSSYENEGVNFIFCTNAVADNVTVQNVLADAWDGDWCYDITIQNSRSINIGGSGYKLNGYKFNYINVTAVNCGLTATEADKGGMVIPDAYGVNVVGLITSNCHPSLYLSGAQRINVNGAQFFQSDNSFTNVLIHGGTSIGLNNIFAVGGYGVWVTNNIGGSSGPTGLSIKNSHWWTRSMLHVFTSVFDADVQGNYHRSESNPLAGASTHSIFINGSERGIFANNNLRSQGGSNFRVYGAFHNNVIRGNTFGNHSGTALYFISPGAATNNVISENIFTVNGATAFTTDVTAFGWNKFNDNISKGAFYLRGGTNYILNNIINGDFGLFSSTVSNYFDGNIINGTYSGTGADVDSQRYGQNQGSATALTARNADYYALNFRAGLTISSNAPAVWPTAPRKAGDWFITVSNDVMIALISSGGSTWTATNKFTTAP